MVIYSDYKRALAKFRSNNGEKPVDLFAVLKMDEVVDKWSILLAASWINESNRKETFDSLVKTLVAELKPEELSEIARVGVTNSDEHLIKLFLDKFSAGQHIKENAQINGNVIHEGYIIESEKNPNPVQETLGL